MSGEQANDGESDHKCASHGFDGAWVDALLSFQPSSVDSKRPRGCEITEPREFLFPGAAPEEAATPWTPPRKSADTGGISDVSRLSREVIRNAQDRAHRLFRSPDGAAEASNSHCEETHQAEPGPEGRAS